VATYTVDAVAVLCYLVDSLPRPADRIFTEGEAGEVVLHVPTTALAEVLYAVSREKDVRGVELTATPEEVRRAVLTDGPLSLAPIGEDELGEFARIVDRFSIHDALVVASHRARETEAIVTSDGAIRESGVETVWE